MPPKHLHESGGVGTAVRTAAPRRRPDRIGKASIIDKARDHVPVKMRHLIAKRREIYLIWMHYGAYCLFRGKHRLHEVYARAGGKVSHLLYMDIPDHPAIPGMIGIVDEDNTTAGAMPQHVFVVRTAKRARYLWVRRVLFHL